MNVGDRAMARLTVRLPADLMADIRARVERGSISSWIAQPVAERLVREGLAAAIAEYEAQTGASGVTYRLVSSIGSITMPLSSTP